MKIELNKLIRDGLIDIFEKRGYKTSYHEMTDINEITKSLSNKIKEEAAEVSEAIVGNDCIHLMEEIGDLYDVVDAVCKELDLDKDCIEHMRKSKRKRLGGFDKKIFCEYYEN